VPATKAEPTPPKDDAHVLFRYIVHEDPTTGETSSTCVPIPRKFVDMYRQRFRPVSFQTAQGGLLLRHEPKRGIFIPDGEESIGAWIAEKFREVGEVATPQFCRLIIHDVRHETFTDRKEFNPEGYLCLANGVLNLTNPSQPIFAPRSIVPNAPWLTPDAPGVPKFTISIPVSYDPTAPCPEWLKFLEQALPTPFDRQLLQQVFGLALARNVAWKTAILLLGPRDTGKSTTLTVLRELLGGKPNVTSKTLQQLTGEDRFAAIALVDAFANIYSDVPSRATDVGMFKALTGGMDEIDVQAKYGHAFSANIRALQLYSANRLPAVRGADEAFYSRWWILLFQHPFQRKGEDYWKHFIPEFSGILNWAIQGLASVQRSGPAIIQTPRQIQSIWTRWSNSVLAFVDECLDPAGTESWTVLEMYARYQGFCKMFGAEPLEQKAFTRDMNELYGRAHHIHYMVTDHPDPHHPEQLKRTRLWKGCGWKDTSHGP
jgi:P4 family phage/plasmid primase-like protien